MSLNQTPSAERLHIGIFGRRNVGKSSLINALTGQTLSIVSEIKGTTTDPVLKAMELAPLGPIVLIDTPGLDDCGALGAMRVQKTYEALRKTDLALLVLDATVGMTESDKMILQDILKRGISYLIISNKSDCCAVDEKNLEGIAVSAVTGYHIEELKQQIASCLKKRQPSRPLVRDLIAPMELVILVVPIDASAPKGRLILPQQQTIRELLECGAITVVVKPSELEETLKRFPQQPRLVITDSQVFSEVASIVPKEIALTSFSILFARYKGNLSQLVSGARGIDTLQDGDAVLICEGCTHHRQCEDIGTVKLPRWLSEYTKKQLSYTFTSGMDFPDDLSHYQLIIHCGGCMLNAQEMQHRLSCAEKSSVPMTNYGTAIAHMNGILARSLEPYYNQEENNHEFFKHL